MKKTIFILMLFLVMATASAEIEHYYKVDLTYNRGEINYRDVSIEPSQEQLETPGSGYVAELVSFDNKILNITYFGMPIEILYDSVDPKTGEIAGGGMVELNETETTLYVPYHENAQEINIYDYDLNKKLTIDLKEYSKEDIIEEKVPEIKEAEEKEEVTEKEEKPITNYILIGILLALVIIIIIYFMRRRKNVQI